MKTRKLFKILYVLAIPIFITGLSLGMIGRSLCVNDNKNYKTTLPQIETVEEIATVLQNDSGYIYVCYNDGSYVNVFDEKGKFLWAVSTPYLRNSYFELKDADLIVYGTDAYSYNSSTGAFISKSNPESLDLSFDWENTGITKENVKTDEFYFNTYDVFKIADDGSKIYIVHKPVWYYIFYFPLDWIFGFAGAILLGILLTIKITSKYRKIKKVKIEKFTNPRLAKMLTYIKITIAVNVVYAVFNILSGIFWNGILSIGLVPLALHFIVSNIIFSNIKDKITHNSKQKTAVDFWMTYSIASFILAFFSVIAAVLLVG